MSSIPYFILDALKGLKRNFSGTITSVFTVALSLLIFGALLMGIYTTKSIVSNVESKLEVKVFLNKNYTPEEKNNIEQKIKGQFGVSDVQFESKEEAFNKAKESMEEYLKDKDPVNNNPFPSSFIVKMEKPEYIEKFIESLKDTQGIEQVSTQGDVVEKIVSIGKIARYIGAALTGVFMIISVLLIGNTIKLVINARKKEIEIMKFVGATNWFIRWPFILEGLIIGLLGSAISIGILYLSYRTTFNYLSVNVPFFILPKPSIILNTLSWQFVLAGMLVGAVGSFTSLRKHLNV